MLDRPLFAIVALAAVVGCSQAPTEAPEEMIQAARSDLATYLQIGIDDIFVVESRPITWSSSAIGCAESGVGYDEAEVSGFLMVLTTGGAIATYHQGGGDPPFLCLLPTE